MTLNFKTVAFASEEKELVPNESSTQFLEFNSVNENLYFSSKESPPVMAAMFNVLFGFGTGSFVVGDTNDGYLLALIESIWVLMLPVMFFRIPASASQAEIVVYVSLSVLSVAVSRIYGAILPFQNSELGFYSTQKDDWPEYGVSTKFVF